MVPNASEMVIYREIDDSDGEKFVKERKINKIGVKIVEKFMRQTKKASRTSFKFTL